MREVKRARYVNKSCFPGEHSGFGRLGGCLPARVTRCPLHLHCTYKGCEPPRTHKRKKNAYAYDNGGACLRAILMGLGEAIQYFSNPVIPTPFAQAGRQVGTQAQAHRRAGRQAARASEYKVAGAAAHLLSFISACTSGLKGWRGTASTKGTAVSRTFLCQFTRERLLRFFPRCAAARNSVTFSEHPLREMSCFFLQ